MLGRILSYDFPVQESINSVKAIYLANDPMEIDLGPYLKP
jgi:hypothetical protein